MRIFYISFWGTNRGLWDRLDLLFDSLSDEYEIYDVGFLHDRNFKLIIKNEKISYIRFIMPLKILEQKILINQLIRFPFLLYSIINLD
jgi:hypothetical protein